MSTKKTNARKSGCAWVSAYGFDFCDEKSVPDDDDGGSDVTTTTAAVATGEETTADPALAGGGGGGGGGGGAGTEAPGCNKKRDTGDFTCAGSGQTIDCDYVCDDYGPVSANTGPPATRVNVPKHTHCWVLVRPCCPLKEGKILLV